MRKYLIVDTWNGEGYSECKAWFMMFEDDNKASTYAKQEAKIYGQDKPLELYVNPADVMDKSWIYGSEDEDSGSVHFREIGENVQGVIIMPMVNEYEIVTTLERWDEVLELISKHPDYEANDEQQFGQCYDCMGEEENDWILMTPEMMCCRQDALEITMEGDGVEYEIWECQCCKKPYNVPIEIVRDWKNREEA